MALILIAEDEAYQADILQFRLSRAGHSVVHVDNGSEVMARFRETKPDLLLLDVRMPGMNGIEVLKQLKSDPDASNVPVILLTASAQYSDVAVGISAGASDYVTKPYDFRNLLSIINKLLDETQPGTQA